MTFEERAAQVRANTLNGNAVNVSNNDVYNELLLQRLEALNESTASNYLILADINNKLDLLVQGQTEINEVFKLGTDSIFNSFGALDYIGGINTVVRSIDTNPTVYIADQSTNEFAKVNTSGELLVSTGG